MNKQYYEALQEYVLDGEVELAVEATRAQIHQGVDPLAVIQEYLIPILDDIGDKFSRLELFLPDLVMASDVAKGLKDEIREHLLAVSGERASKGKIVIGTIQGDVHDIGKNIVATLLEVNGYEVVDLGNNVSPQEFMQTAEREKADIIALSSLLTTSMPFMEDLISTLVGLKLRDKYKIIVGGGPVSEEWALSIGADGYGSDANHAVALCDRLLAV